MAAVLQNILSLFKGPLMLYNYIKNGYINITKTEEFQEKFKSDLNEITKKNWSANQKKSEEQKSAIKNIKRLYEGREKVFIFYNDYIRMVSEAKYKLVHNTINPVALAQVKADNISGHLLHEIRQTIYSLYQAKEITKKLYNSIMNSIKL